MRLKRLPQFTGGSNAVGGGAPRLRPPYQERWGREKWPLSNSENCTLKLSS